MLKAQVQTALRILFPPTCAGCNVPVDREFAMCGTCWKDLPLISGPVCVGCGRPMLADGPEDAGLCDECIATPRPWSEARAAMRYEGMARKLVLALKHGDRPDIAVTAATWLARAAEPLLREDTVFLPIPIHWSRLVKRKFNQSALLAQNLALKTGHRAIVDGLVRPARTQPLENVSFADRFARLDGAIAVNTKRAGQINGRPVMIVDDVLTSGATLTAATEASYAAGAARVDVLVLARTVRRD